MAGLGRKIFTAGDVLTASDVQSYLQDQAVMVFAGTAARSSAIATPSEGMVTITTDTDELQYYNGTSFVSGLPFGAYTSYTPTITGVTITGGTSLFAFCQIGKTVHVRGSFTLGASSAITGAITVTTPVTASSSAPNVIGTAIFIDAGTAAYNGMVRLPTTTVLNINPINTAGTFALSTVTSSSNPFTWVSTDSFQFSATYEAA